VAAEREDRPTAPQDDIINTWVVPLVVEGIGIMALCFIGIGSIMAFSVADPSGLIGVALAHGLAIGLMVAAGGHISGGAYNPAVTLGLVIGGKLTPVKGVAYVVAQLVGAVIGALLIKASYPSLAVDTVNLGTPGVPKDLAVGRALIAEIVATFFLMYVIFGTAVDARGPKAIASLAIGLTITMDILAVGPISGAAMNPGRWFGPALVQGSWDNWWIYWVGPGIGATIAAILYTYIYLGGKDGP
jgi:MIP family channel proteins